MFTRPIYLSIWLLFTAEESTIPGMDAYFHREQGIDRKAICAYNQENLCRNDNSLSLFNGHTPLVSFLSLYISPFCFSPPLLVS